MHNDDNPGDDHAQRSPEEIAELFEIANREPETIKNLSTWFTDLLEVQAAKDSLSSLTPAEVRAALEYRRLTVRETP